jgi:hypothetical protein
MMAPMRLLLNGLCAVTIAASAWLGVMFVVLQRPGFERGAAVAALFAVQSLLAIAVANGWLSGAMWRAVALAGAAGLTWAGTLALIRNLNGPHFEGYALIIGILLILQGLATLLTLLVKSAPIRQLT